MPISVLTFSLSLFRTRGGYQRYVFEIIRHLSKYNLRFHLITLRPRKDLIGMFSILEKNPNVKIYFAPEWASGFLFLVETFLISLRILKKEKISLIHTHTPFLSIIAQALRRLFRIPIIHTVQALRWVEISLTQGNYLKMRLYEIFEGFMFSREHIITISSQNMKELEKINIEKSRIRIIPNGADIEKFKPISNSSIRRKLEATEPSILFVGSLTKRKGIQYLIQAMPMILKQNPHTMLFIIGTGPLKSELEQQTRLLNIQEHIRFLGEVDHENLPEYYSASDIFVLPSLHEGLGIVLLEAMACQRPVIGTKTGGITDLIIHNKNGLLVNLRSEVEIANAVSYLLKNEDERLKMGLAGRRIVEREFTWQIVARKTRAYYFDVLKKHYIRKS